MDKHFNTQLDIEAGYVSRQGLLTHHVSVVSISTDDEGLHDALVAAVLAVEESRKTTV